jgi:hypothetical protein
MALRFCEVDRPDHRQNAVALDQLLRRRHRRRRIGLVILVDQLHRPAEDATAGVDLLGGQVEAEPGLPAVELDAAGER